MNIQELFKKYYDTKDKDTFQKLVLINERYPDMIAHKLSEIYAFPYEELYEEGILYLIEAIRRYNPYENIYFSTFIHKDLNYKLRIYISENPHLIGNSEYLEKIIDKLSKIENSFDGPIKDQELKLLSNCAYEDIRIYYGLKLYNQFTNTYQVRQEDEKNCEEMAINNVYGKQFIDLLKKLKLRYQVALIYRYGLIDNDCRTLDELGEILNVKREGARQIEHRAIKTLKSKAYAKGLVFFRDND